MPLQAAESGKSGDAGKPVQWNFELGAGAEYDSNVAVSEIDATSGESDYAATADLGIDAKLSPAKGTDLSINYDLSQSSYREFSRVDRQTHILGADLRRDLGKATAGLSTYLVHSRLDAEPFLDLVRVSPSISGFTAKRWFARAAYVYSERRIEDRPSRDAVSHAIEADLYYFHRGLRSYFNIGYRYRDEDAVDDQLSFHSNSIKLRYIRRFTLFDRQAKAELAWRYEERDFEQETTEITAIRQDDRGRWKADLEIPLSQRWQWQLYASYGDYQSNLPTVDFTQTIVGTRLSYRW